MTKKIKWKPVKENYDGIYSETPIGNIIDIGSNGLHKTVLDCCKAPKIYFQLIDVSPITDHFCLHCKSCKRSSAESGWSYWQAIAVWNISLWNPKYFQNKANIMADELEKLAKDFESEKITSSVAVRMNEMFDKMPEMLRSLVVDSESNRLEKYSKIGYD